MGHPVVRAPAGVEGRNSRVWLFNYWCHPERSAAESKDLRFVLPGEAKCIVLELIAILRRQVEDGDG
jgi:hypothetical protein